MLYWCGIIRCEVVTNLSHGLKYLIAMKYRNEKRAPTSSHNR
uniref:Uncharacterized protein n=1 Tax=Arundo donax TaxID=35708 RepID=A0A0A9E6R3_ARUDO